MGSVMINVNWSLTNEMLISYDVPCLEDDEGATMGVNSSGR
jgi:hypothetical protein